VWLVLVLGVLWLAGLVAVLLWMFSRMGIGPW
jgi:hypothetical protein